MSTLAIANTISIITPMLAFFGGIYFAKWMRQRRDRRSAQMRSPVWGRR